jgi:hypothetical protein
MGNSSHFILSLSSSSSPPTHARNYWKSLFHNYFHNVVPALCYTQRALRHNKIDNLISQSRCDKSLNTHRHTRREDVILLSILLHSIILNFHFRGKAFKTSSSHFMSQSLYIFTSQSLRVCSSEEYKNTHTHDHLTRLWCCKAHTHKKCEGVKCNKVVKLHCKHSWRKEKFRNDGWLKEKTHKRKCVCVCVCLGEESLKSSVINRI